MCSVVDLLPRAHFNLLLVQTELSVYVYVCQLQILRSAFETAA